LYEYSEKNHRRRKMSKHRNMIGMTGHGDIRYTRKNPKPLPGQVNKSNKNPEDVPEKKCVSPEECAAIIEQQRREKRKAIENGESLMSGCGTGR
jgi:hypothetical protein